MSWNDYKRFKETGSYTPGGDLWGGPSPSKDRLSPEVIAKRKAQLAKTFALPEAVMERMAPRFVRAMHANLVTGAPVMASAIHNRELLGKPAEGDFHYAPYPELVLVPYFIANSLQRFFKRPDMLAVGAKWLQKKLLPESGSLPFFQVGDKTYELPDFEALPKCDAPGKTMVAAYVDHHFYWLTIRDAGDDTEAWLKDAMLAIETFPTLAGVFFKDSN